MQGRTGRRLGGAVARWVGGISRLSAAAAAVVVVADAVAAVVNVVSAVAVLVAVGCARGAAICCGP